MTTKPYFDSVLRYVDTTSYGTPVFELPEDAEYTILWVEDDYRMLDTADPGLQYMQLCHPKDGPFSPAYGYHVPDRWTSSVEREGLFLWKSVIAYPEEKRDRMYQTLINHLREMH